jgi:uncharacterized circularly permuted ATP-grasp superfamily protein/uncharacterized alpha-E superfamily protein
MSLAFEGRSSLLDQVVGWHPVVHAALSDPHRLREWQHHADRLLVSEGAGHLVHDLPVRADGRGAGIESRPWRLDPLPIVLDTPVFQWLAGAVSERMEALEALLVDLYGPRRSISDRLVPGSEVYAAPGYRMAAVGSIRPLRWLTSYAVDLVQMADGTWKIVQDITDAPDGLGYTLLDRSVMSRISAELQSQIGVASLSRFADVLRRGLASTTTVASPRTVLVTGGIDHASYIDHSYLAVQLGITLVEGADLVVRQRRVWLRTLDGVEPVDVVYRRLESDTIDPLEVGSVGTAGVPGLLMAVRSGGVVLANAHGAGVIQDPRLARHWARAVAGLTGQNLRLEMAPEGLRAGPQMAVAPLHGDDGVTPGSVVLRMHAVFDGHGVSVLPGGTGRVLAPGDDPRRPTACSAKDVWVLGRTLTPFVVSTLPQVDFVSSVPTRAAASLYWMNRYAERTDAMTRTARVISARLEQDPGLAGVDGGGWTQRMQEILRWLRRAPQETSDLPGIDALYDDLARTGDAIAVEIGNLLTEATCVREFLSVTTGRVLERVSRCRTSLQRHVVEVDDLDTLLSDMAALAGLWNESTVRGLAWRIGDIGRGLERSLVLLDALVPGLPGPQGDAERTDTDVLTLEVLLAANESLVAYRRRYRSDVEVEATCSLLITDPSNPRSLAASLLRIAGHAEAVGWEAGRTIIDRALDEVAAFDQRDGSGVDVSHMVLSVRSTLDEFSRAVVERWFAAPVAPMVLSGRKL